MKLVYVTLPSSSTVQGSRGSEIKIPQVDALVLRTKIFIKVPARKFQFKSMVPLFYRPRTQGGEHGLMLRFTIAIIFR